MTEQYHDRQTMERLHQHLARAERELRDAQHFFDPDSAEETEMDLVHAVAAARLAVTTALERVRSRLGEPEA
jgi:capsule polysaccharide export protein KpsE/RkpR